MSEIAGKDVDQDVARVLAKLRRLKGARGALLAMTGDWRFCGKATFSAGGAHSLFWACGGYRYNPFVESEVQKDGKWSRTAYRLTPLGLAVRSLFEGQSPNPKDPPHAI